MYENEYEDYMRNILGYPVNANTYMSNSFPYRNNTNVEHYENLYPDIYKMLKPMVQKVCNNYRGSTITDDTLESMATEIYNNIESDITAVNINVTTAEAGNNMVRSNNKSTSKVPANSKDNDEELTRGCCGNPVLKDLIKILLLNQLINNNHNRPPRPPRPPFNPYPPRPPRPPYRDFENSGYYDNYMNDGMFQ